MARVIAVGLGHRGRRWVEWAAHAGAEVVGVVDANAEVVAEVGQALGFDAGRRFLSIREAVARVRPEAAVICVPHHAHPVLVEEALRSGLHVLVEKPLAQEMHVALRLVRLAGQAGLQLVVAQQYRYSAAMRRIKALVAERTLGDLTGGVIQFYRWRPTRGMRLPILLNQAIHHFDALRFIMGSTPLSCTAQLWDPAWNGCDGPTATEATFQFPGGARIHYSGSYVARGSTTGFDGVWRLEGSEGQLLYDGEESIQSYGPSGVERILVARRGRESTIQLCQDFLRSIATGEPAPTHGADNLHTLAMAFAVERSAQLGREVALDELFGEAGADRAG